MEIQTHVLTNPQPSLRADTQEAATRRSNARSNIEAAKKPTNTSVDNLAGFDANGEIVDSGVAKADLVHDAEYVHIDGYVKDAVVTEDGKKLTLTKNDDTHVDFMGGSGLPTPTQEDEGYVLTVDGGQAVWAEPSHVDVSGKMDKVQGAPENNLVAFDNKGNAKNSGIATSAVSDALSKLGSIETGAQVNVIDTVKVDGIALTVTDKTVDIVGKENVSNKVTSWSQQTTDVHYPSEKLVKDSLDNKVDKVPDKGLSTEDYSTAEKTKLGTIESGAQVNVIDTVKVNGTALTPANKAVDIDLSGYKTVQTAAVQTGSFREAVNLLKGIENDPFLTPERVQKYVDMLTAADAITYADYGDTVFTASMNA